MAVATVVTLILVPVFYSIVVLDLRIIKWQPGGHWAVTLLHCDRVALTTE